MVCLRGCKWNDGTVLERTIATLVRKRKLKVLKRARKAFEGDPDMIAEFKKIESYLDSQRSVVWWLEHYNDSLADWLAGATSKENDIVIRGP